MRIERKEGLAWRKIGDETIVVHLGRKRMYCLNGSGSEAWARLDGPTSLEDLWGTNVDRDALLRFVGQLSDEELVAADGLPAERPVEVPREPDPLVPRIVWSEPIERFAGLCALRAGQGLSCNQNPSAS